MGQGTESGTVSSGGSFQRFLPKKAEDLAALALSAFYFLLLLCAYYMLRPIRDALAATIGAGTIKYLSSTVFFVMLLIVPIFGLLVAKLPRARLLPMIHAFFILNLAIFAALFHLRPDERLTACAFYVWLTVFNYFIVSIFWSLMADRWREAEGRHLFGIISAGGSIGGLIGPLAARALVVPVGIAGTIAVAAGVFMLASICLLPLAKSTERRSGESAADAARPLGGSPIEGVLTVARSPFVAGIAALVFMGSLIAMIVYIELAKATAQAFPTTELRAHYFSGRDLWVNGLACLLQAGVLAQLTTRIGVGRTLVLCSILVALAFGLIGLIPSLAVLTGVNVLLRVAEFGLAKPSRDMLYTVVDPSTRYKAKNFIDTALSRGADMVSGFIHDGLGSLGLTLAGFGALGVGLGLGLGAAAAGVGRGYRRRGGL